MKIVMYDAAKRKISLLPPQGFAQRPKPEEAS